MHSHARDACKWETGCCRVVSTVLAAADRDEGVGRSAADAVHSHVQGNCTGPIWPLVGLAQRQAAGQCVLLLRERFLFSGNENQELWLSGLYLRTFPSFEYRSISALGLRGRGSQVWVTDSVIEGNKQLSSSAVISAGARAYFRGARTCVCVGILRFSWPHDACACIVVYHLHHSAPPPSSRTRQHSTEGILRRRHVRQHLSILWRSCARTRHYTITGASPLQSPGRHHSGRA